MVAGVPRQAGRHQQHRGTHALAAAGPDVLADLRDQLNPRLDVAREFVVDLLEVGANRFEDLRQGQRFFHSGSGGLYHGLNRV